MVAYTPAAGAARLVLKQGSPDEDLFPMPRLGEVSL